MLRRAISPSASAYLNVIFFVGKLLILAFPVIASEAATKKEFNHEGTKKKIF